MTDLFYPEPATKTCRRCRKEKPLAEFNWTRGRGRRYHRGTCKTCDGEWHRIHGRTDRRRLTKRVVHLRDFNLSLEDYDAMLAAQGGVCAICGYAEAAFDKRTGGPRRLAIDHDHKTGRVRGLLCGSCNPGISLFKDDPVRLHAAISYLQRHADQLG